MEITLSNCNNIVHGTVSVEENRLNIKYAINGTGKSTIAKSIEYSANHDENALKGLTPYRNIGETDTARLPTVAGLPEDAKIAVFDESYVNQYVFLEDELLKNSFDIFIRTENYERLMNEINDLVANMGALFEAHPELDSTISDMSEFISSFGKARSGIANNGAIVKGFGNGNLIQHIPEGLEDYAPFLNDNRNAKWLKWQSDGRAYMELSSKCPFCTSELELQRVKIDRISEEYDAKIIEHLSKILDLFERLGQYFSQETNDRVREITSNVHGLSEEQKQYLVEIKNNVDTFMRKMQALKNIGFASLKDVDQIADVLDDYKIDLRYMPHLNAPFTQEKVATINSAIEDLRIVVGRLQGAVNQQKAEIAQTVRRYSNEINAFLQNAGYNYSVSIDEAADHTYKLKLKASGGEAAISGVKKHLSYGERNAFALVLFMYNALYNGANFIILDDPISSFDKNKKFAILDMLFIQGGSFRGKTALLLTHDFEPVIDAIYNHPSFFDRTPKAAFLENKDGELQETEIAVDNIRSSIQIAKDNIANIPNPVSKLIYLRRYVEIYNGKSNAWHLLSNLFHKRPTPKISENAMTDEQIEDATVAISQYVGDFDYNAYLLKFNNQGEMVALYNASRSNYEKLQLYRIILGATGEGHVLRKFINETYHVENDYLFQLNPIEFNTIPDYIIRECDARIAEIP